MKRKAEDAEWDDGQMFLSNVLKQQETLVGELH